MRIVILFSPSIRRRWQVKPHLRLTDSVAALPIEPTVRLFAIEDVLIAGPLLSLELKSLHHSPRNALAAVRQVGHDVLNMAHACAAVNELPLDDERSRADHLLGLEVLDDDCHISAGLLLPELEDLCEGFLRQVTYVCELR